MQAPDELMKKPETYPARVLHFTAPVDKAAFFALEKSTFKLSKYYMVQYVKSNTTGSSSHCSELQDGESPT
jgi:hypothetical protein